MSRYTDENVPVTCHECESLCEGYTDTICHILQAHNSEYTQDEAAMFAQIWVEEAHIEQDEQEANYYADRKLERQIRGELPYVSKLK